MNFFPFFLSRHSAVFHGRSARAHLSLLPPQPGRSLFHVLFSPRAAIIYKRQQDKTLPRRTLFSEGNERGDNFIIS